MAKVALLQGTGSPHWTGFPTTYGQNSGTFGAALWGTLRGWEFVWNFNFLCVPANKNVLAGTLLANKSLLDGTVLANKSIQ